MALSVIQGFNWGYTTGHSSPQTNWSSAPTPGNLLVLMGCAYASPQYLPVNGWNFLQPVAQPSGGFGWILFKYAGASEPLSQQVLTNGAAFWEISGFEIAGVTGNPWTDIVVPTTVSLGIAPSTTITPTPQTVIPNGTTLVLGQIGGSSTHTSFTAAWSGNSSGWVTPAALFVSPNADIQLGAFDWATGAYLAIASGSAAPTLTLSLAPAQSYFNMVCLGVAPSVGVDPASPAPGTTNGTVVAGGSLTATVTVNTVKANEVIVVDVSMGSASAGGTPTLAVSGGGLTWHQRQGPFAGPAGGNAFLSRWWAQAPSALSAAAISVQCTWPGPGAPGLSCVSAGAFGIGGVSTPSSPWDPNVSLPRAVINTASTTFNTTNTLDLLVYIGGNTTSSTGPIFVGGPPIIGYGNSNGAPSSQSTFIYGLQGAGAHTATISNIVNMILADAISSVTPPVSAVGVVAGHSSLLATPDIPEDSVGEVIGRAHVSGIAQPTAPQTPQFPFPTLQNQINSYLYVWCNDDDNLQSMVAAYNAYAQSYLDWFNSIYIPVYTNGTISGTMLDWVATNLYGIARPGLPEPGKPGRGPFNTYTLNSLAFNAGKPGTPGTFFITSDDYYKRILTWLFYKGDGKVFNIRWLKRRVERFLTGLNGTDPGIVTTYDVSVQFTGPTAVTITVSPTTAASAIFKAAADAGVLELPFQITWTVTA
jgi:hypothetical protein